MLLWTPRSPSAEILNKLIWYFAKMRLPNVTVFTLFYVPIIIVAQTNRLFMVSITVNVSDFKFGVDSITTLHKD